MSSFFYSFKFDYHYKLGQLSLFQSQNRKYLTNRNYVYIDGFVNMLVIFLFILLWLSDWQ